MKFTLRSEDFEEVLYKVIKKYSFASEEYARNSAREEAKRFLFEFKK